jgi:CRP-like cAMP-binding protein
MYFPQSDLLRGMSKTFVKEFLEIATKESYGEGYFLFHEGDPARNFYILLKKQVKLRIGETGHVVYTVDHPGEAFGWSSLVGRSEYSASAECRKPTKLLEFGAEKLNKVLERDSTNGLIFLKRLSGLLGTRLLHAYKMISIPSREGTAPSFGTGQVAESRADTL